jgi:hypothetical protein
MSVDASEDTEGTNANWRDVLIPPETLRRDGHLRACLMGKRVLRWTGKDQGDILDALGAVPHTGALQPDLTDLASVTDARVVRVSCARCGGAGTHRCGRCRKVRYCGRGCQHADWAAHKLVCQVTPSERLGDMSYEAPLWWPYGGPLGGPISSYVLDAHHYETHDGREASDTH